MDHPEIGKMHEAKQLLNSETGVDLDRFESHAEGVVEIGDVMIGIESLDSLTCFAVKSGKAGAPKDSLDWPMGVDDATR